MPAGVPEISKQLHAALQEALDAGHEPEVIVDCLHVDTGCQKSILSAHLADKHATAGTAGEVAQAKRAELAAAILKATEEAKQKVLDAQKSK